MAMLGDSRIEELADQSVLRNLLDQYVDLSPVGLGKSNELVPVGVPRVDRALRRLLCEEHHDRVVDWSERVGIVSESDHGEKLLPGYGLCDYERKQVLEGLEFNPVVIIVVTGLFLGAALG